MKTKLKKKVSKKKKVARSKVKPKVIVIRTSREERPRMRDSVASGFGAGFGVAAGHEVGDWLLNPRRKGRRRNPINKKSIADIDKDPYKLYQLKIERDHAENDMVYYFELYTEYLATRNQKKIKEYLDFYNAARDRRDRFQQQIDDFVE